MKLIPAFAVTPDPSPNAAVAQREAERTAKQFRRACAKGKFVKGHSLRRRINKLRAVANWIS